MKTNVISTFITTVHKWFYGNLRFLITMENSIPEIIRYESQERACYRCVLGEPCDLCFQDDSDDNSFEDDSDDDDDDYE